MCDLGTRELQTLTKTLLTSGSLTTPPAEVVARRARRIQQRRVRTAAAGALVLALFATASVRWAWHDEQSSDLRVVDGATTTTTTTTPAPPPPRPADAAAPSVAPPAVTGPARAPTTRPAPLSCAPGANGGATDGGVTGDRIRITMTETLRFPERYTTVAAYQAIQNYFDTVNFHGGVCGRLLDLDLVNPVWGTASWDSGADALAGIAGPLDENADQAVADGRVDRSATPLVSTGLTPEHFRSPWVWPVLPPVQSVTRIAVDHAYRTLQARTFALVYEANIRLAGAAPAFEQYVATLPDAAVVHVQRVHGDRDDFRRHALDVAKACKAGGCDFLLFVASATAMSKWPAERLVRGRLATAGYPALGPYVSKCVPLGADLDCDGVHLWAQPTPASDPALPNGVTLPWTTSSVELTLVDGAVVGAARLVEAIRRLGPAVTRDRLRAALDDVAAEHALVRLGPNDRRVFDVPARASKPTRRDDGPLPFYELRPFTDWLRDPTRY